MFYKQLMNQRLTLMVILVREQCCFDLNISLLKCCYHKLTKRVITPFIQYSWRTAIMVQMIIIKPQTDNLVQTWFPVVRIFLVIMAKKCNSSIANFNGQVVKTIQFQLSFFIHYIFSIAYKLMNEKYELVWMIKRTQNHNTNLSVMFGLVQKKRIEKYKW